MGGTLGVDSTPGQGSTFWFELPFARATAASLPAPAAGGDSAPRPRRLDGLRVLIADDSPENRLIAERMLQREGAGVMLAGNGREALDLLAAHPDGFDLVLMDMQMPVMDGFAATRAIRAGSLRPDLPVVAYTAGVLREEREAMIAAGVDDILTKPVDLERMVALLSRWHAAPPLADSTPGSPAAPSTASPLSPEHLHARLAELDHMLANGMLAAREAMRDIEAGSAGTPQAERLRPVAEAVRKLAFAEARQHLARILAETSGAA
jgi:CheY-like chemotaxis protein